VKPTKNVIIQALKLAQSSNKAIPVNVSLRELADRGFGRITGRNLNFTTADRRAVRNWLESQGIDWKTSPSAFNNDRMGAAELAVDEKLGLAAPNEQRVLMSAMGPDVLINGQPLPVIHGAVIDLPAAQIHSLSARYLLLVENKAAFQNMHRIAGHFEKEGVLAIYRGDCKASHAQRWARQAADVHEINLATYMDFDPAGIDMGLAAHASAVLVPDIHSLEELKGNSADFRNQHIQWQHLRQDDQTPAALEAWLAYLARRQQGFTQERMIAHSIPHQLIHL